MWVPALPPWAPSFPRPRAKAVSVLLSGPGVQRHSGCHGQAAAGTHRPYPAEPRPSGLRPWGTGLGSREVCAAAFTLLNHFPNFPGGLRDLCLCLTPGLPFLPQFGDVKIQGLPARPVLRLCLLVDQSHPPGEPWHCMRLFPVGQQSLEGQQGWGAGPVGLGIRERTRVLLASSLHIPGRSVVPEGRLRAGALGVPM